MIDLKKAVHDALDNAEENGYGDESRNDTLENVAINLMDYDYDIGEAQVSVMDLIPHIETWRKAHE